MRVTKNVPVMIAVLVVACIVIIWAIVMSLGELSTVWYW